MKLDRPRRMSWVLTCAYVYRTVYLRRVTQHWIHQDGANKKAIHQFGSDLLFFLKAADVSKILHFDMSINSSYMSLTQLPPLSGACTSHSIYSLLINVQRVNSLWIWWHTDRHTSPKKTHLVYEKVQILTFALGSRKVPLFSRWWKKNKHSGHVLQIKWKWWN